MSKFDVMAENNVDMMAEVGGTTLSHDFRLGFTDGKYCVVDVSSGETAQFPTQNDAKLGLRYVREDGIWGPYAHLPNRKYELVKEEN